MYGSSSERARHREFSLLTMQKNFFIIISGPTAVGKTDFVNTLSMRLGFPVEIINVDVGQFYTPLSIGTAKPEYQKESIKHHFFDIIDQPRDFTVAEFRRQLITLMQDMWSRDVTPLLVGGSGFYVQSIFFPPRESEHNEAQQPTSCPEKSVPSEFECVETSELWNRLKALDAERAQSIHPNDRYRIERALKLLSQGSKPSELVPQFDPPGVCAFYFLTRERDELYARINERVDIMLRAGLLDEVRNLDVSWKQYLLKKKLIGYPELIQFLEESAKYDQIKYNEELAKAAEKIKKNTRAYAKRQITFWRMMRKKLECNDPNHAFLKKISEVNLTNSPLDLYIERVGRELIDLKAALK